MTRIRFRNAGWSRRTGVVLTAGAGLLLASVGAALAATSDLSIQVDSTYQTNDRVETILPIGNTVYVGGRFTSVRPADAPAGTSLVTRMHLAAFDRTTGALLPWNPGTDKEVMALTASLDGNSIYVGGTFTRVAGVSRSRLAQVDAATGALLPWAPRTDQQVNTVSVTPDWIYFGGTFDIVNGQPRTRLAAVDSAGNLRTDWHPQADNRVRVIVPAPDGASLFIGGDFLSIDGNTAQKILVRLSTSDGSPLPWRLHPGYPVYGIAFFDTMLYAAGNGSGGHIGAFDLATGTRLWTQQTDGGVQAIAIKDGVIYGGGHFDNVCVGVTEGATTGFHCPQNAATRHKLVAIDAVTGTLDPWNPGANSPLGVYGLAVDAGALEVGGDFTKIGSPDKLGQALHAQQGFGQFSPLTP